MGAQEGGAHMGLRELRPRCRFNDRSITKRCGGRWVDNCMALGIGEWVPVFLHLFLKAKTFFHHLFRSVLKYLKISWRGIHDLTKWTTILEFHNVPKFL